MVSEDRLSRVFGALKKNFPGASGSAKVEGAIQHLSTGSLLLDRVLGGGPSVGRVTMFYGEKGGGKTTSAQRTIAESQGLCRNCLRPAHNVQSVPPSDDVLSQNPEARWSASGECDCVREGVANPRPPIVYAGETGTEYRSRVTKWKNRMKENSYDEMICSWVDPENAFDETWASCIGVDTSRLFLVKPATGEEGVDIVTAIIESGQIDLLCVDSLAHFTPRKEYEESSEKWQQGLQARIVNKGIRKWIVASVLAARQGHPVTQIWMNQLRTNIGVTFGDPNVKPAGRAQDFAVSAEVKFLASKTEVIEEQYGTKKEVVSTPVKEQIRFKNTKGRTRGSPKGISGSYFQSLIKNDVYEVAEVMDDELMFKLAKHFMFGDDKTYSLCGRDFKTQADIKQAIRADAAFHLDLRVELLERLIDG